MLFLALATDRQFLLIKGLAYGHYCGVWQFTKELARIREGLEDSAVSNELEQNFERIEIRNPLHLISCICVISLERRASRPAELQIH